jgi:hypothetical protein
VTAPTRLLKTRLGGRHGDSVNLASTNYSISPLCRERLAQSRSGSIATLSSCSPEERAEPRFIIRRSKLRSTIIVSNSARQHHFTCVDVAREIFSMAPRLLQPISWDTRRLRTFGDSALPLGRHDVQSQRIRRSNSSVAWTSR